LNISYSLKYLANLDNLYLYAKYKKGHINAFSGLSSAIEKYIFR